MPENDLINKELNKAQQKADEIAKQTGLKEKDWKDKAGEAVNGANKAIGDTWNSTINGASLLPAALGAASNPKNRQAWLKPPTAEQLVAYQVNKDNPDYQKIVEALGGLNDVMTTATVGNNIPEGAGIHYVAGAIYKNSKDLQGAGAVLAGGGEILSNPWQSGQETLSRVVNAFNSTDDWGQKVGAVIGAFGDSFNEVKKEVIDDRLALMKRDLSNLGFQDNLIDLVAGETRKVAVKEAGIEQYVNQIPKISGVKLDANQSSVPTETPQMIISGNSKGVGK
jgi:hypothetical protein